jgi:hypothetical protein
VTVYAELPDSAVGYSSAVCSSDNMDFSQGIYRGGGGVEATLIVSVIVVLTMTQLAFHYELTSHSNSCAIQIHT